MCSARLARKLIRGMRLGDEFSAASAGEPASHRLLVAHAQRLVDEVAALAHASQIAVEEGEARISALLGEALSSRADELRRVVAELERSA